MTGGAASLLPDAAGNSKSTTMQPPRYVTAHHVTSLAVCGLVAVAVDEAQMDVRSYNGVNYRITDCSGHRAGPKCRNICHVSSVPRFERRPSTAMVVRKLSP